MSDSITDILSKVKNVSLFTDAVRDRGYIDTGIEGLNYIISGDVAKGIPYGRVVELYGNESNGKSSVGYSILAHAQRHNILPILLDAEGVFDNVQAERCGIDPSKLLYMESNSAERMFATLNQIIIQNKTTPMIALCDSIAALGLHEELLADEEPIVVNGRKASEKAQIDMLHKAYNSNQPGVLARKLSKVFNFITPALSSSNCALLCLNQARMNLSRFVPTIDTTGGKALKFYSSVRIQIEKIDVIKEKVNNTDVSVGIQTRLTSAKNKVYRPYLSFDLPILFKTGVDREGALFDFAKSFDIFKQCGAYYEFNDVKNHAKEWRELLRTDSELRDVIRTRLTETLATLDI